MAIEYTLRRNDEGEIIDCYCCGYPAPLFEFDPPPLSRNRTEKSLFCKLCANTFIASAYQYPLQHADDGVILRTLGYLGNAILAAIASLKEPTDAHQR